MVLDGLLQHSQAESSNLILDSVSYEATLRKFFDWCGEREVDECLVVDGDKCVQPANSRRVRELPRLDQLHRVTDAATILMLQSLYDPNTGFAWALGVRDELNAVLLIRDGTGHTSWLLGGATAAAAEAYLLDLTLPEPGTILDS